MSAYQFRADVRSREVPSFGQDQWTRLEKLLKVRFDTCSPDLGDVVPFSAELAGKFLGCRKKQCLFGLQTQDNGVQVTLGMLADSSSVVIRVSPELLPSAPGVEKLRKELFTYFGHVDSVSVSELSPESTAISRNREIASPPVHFASGTEWYVCLSPAAWQPYYSRELVLDAPAKVQVLKNGFLEWYAYDSLLRFDAEAVIRNRKYFGDHRQRALESSGPS